MIGCLLVRDIGITGAENDLILIKRNDGL